MNELTEIENAIDEFEKAVWNRARAGVFQYDEDELEKLSAEKKSKRTHLLELIKEANDE